MQEQGEGRDGWVNVYVYARVCVTRVGGDKGRCGCANVMVFTRPCIAAYPCLPPMPYHLPHATWDPTKTLPSHSTQPAIESCSSVRFGCLDAEYPGMADHLKSAGLDPLRNFWSLVFDFTADENPDSWEFMSPFVTGEELLHGPEMAGEGGEGWWGGWVWGAG